MEVVSFEIAKKLKEKGFSLPSGEVIGKYDSDGVYHSQLYVNFTETMDSEEIIAPTISQVLKWLREEKEIHISADITGAGWINNIVIKVKPIKDGFYWYSKKHRETEFYNSYEEAIIEAIEYVLDNLI